MHLTSGNLGAGERRNRRPVAAIPGDPRQGTAAGRGEKATGVSMKIHHFQNKNHDLVSDFRLNL